MASWLVAGAAIDKKNRAIRARILCPALPAEQRRREIETVLGMAYSVERVELAMELLAPEEPAFEDVPLPEPPGEEDIPLPEPPPEDIPLPEPPPEEAAPAPDPFQITEEIRRKALENLPVLHVPG